LIYFQHGDQGNARIVTEEALRLSQENNEKAVQGRSWISLGRILGQEEPSQIHEAEECILKGMKILQDLKAKALYSLGILFLGELFLNVDEKEKAVKNLKRAEEMFREMEMEYWLTQTLEVLRRL
jgi:tetratricopeptide (TPR) repeat protein